MSTASTIRERCAQQRYDAIIVGSGPNGLAAAITLARAGRSVLVIEAEETIGGGARSAPLTLPGFVHDRCSAIHPLGVGSPFFQSVPLADFGLEWIYPEVQLAHPFDGGSAVALDRSVERTAEQLGIDAGAYRAVIGTVAEGAGTLVPDLLGPLRVPRDPIRLARLARFGMLAVLPATMLARALFRTEAARGSSFSGPRRGPLARPTG